MKLILQPFNCIWPCAIRSCHFCDMPKIASKYAFAHWHNLKSVHPDPTIVKVYIFRKLFLQGFQKWHYFCGRGKSENITADQTLKFCLKRCICFWMADFQHAIPHIEFKARFELFRARPIHTYSVLGSHLCFTEKSMVKTDDKSKTIFYQI